MRIPQETIEAIEAAVQVEEVLGAHVTLRRRGKKYFCPFHDDKHPSFSITADGKFYTCFSCGEKGSAVSFLMTKQGMSYPEAMRALAERYHIPWALDQDGDGEVSQEHQAREAMHLLLAEVKGYFEERLRGPEGEAGMAYLAGRSLDDSKVLAAFGLGYSLPAWRALYDHARMQGYDEASLEAAGLVIVKADQERRKAYDRFRGRLIFPLIHLGGKVVGFAGRKLDSDPKSPKYINSPETLVYRKRHFLYGLYQARQAIKQHGHCYIVEGYTDVLAMHCAGLPHVVASGGTALTEQQIGLLHRYSRQVIMLFDGDQAGTKAVLRGIDPLLRQGCDVKVVALPPQEDPESFRREVGDSGLRDYVKAHVQDFVTFQATQLFDAAKDNPLQRAEATRTLLDTLAQVADPIKRTFYLQACAERIGLSQAMLEEQLAQRLQPEAPQIERRPPFAAGAKRAAFRLQPPQARERTLLYFLLHYSHHAFSEEQRLADYLFATFPTLPLASPAYQKLWAQCQTTWQNQPSTPLTDTIESWPEDLQTLAREVMAYKKPSPNWETLYQTIFVKETESLPKHTMEAAQRLQMAHLNQRLHESMASLGAVQDAQAKHDAFDAYCALLDERNALAKTLRVVVTENYALSPHQPCTEESSSN